MKNNVLLTAEASEKQLEDRIWARRAQAGNGAAFSVDRLHLGLSAPIPLRDAALAAFALSGRFMRTSAISPCRLPFPPALLLSGHGIALVPAVGFALVILRRAQLEDEFLKKNLSGYVDYARCVPARLLPFRRTTGRSHATDFA